MDEDQLKMLILKLAMKEPDFGDTLIAAEVLLRKQKYEEAEEILAPLLKQPERVRSSSGFIIHYFTGRAIYKKEMAGAKPREEEIDKAMDHLSRSIDQNAEYADTYIYRGLAAVEKAKFHTPGTEWLRAAQQDFKSALKKSDIYHRRHAAGHLSSISTALRKLRKGRQSG